MNDRVHSQLRMNKSKIGKHIRPVRSSVYTEQLEQAAYCSEKGEDSRMSDNNEFVPGLQHVGIQD